MLKFLKFLGRKKWLIILIIILIVFQACSDLLFAVLLRDVISLITDHLQETTMSEIVFCSLKMLGAAFAGSLFAIIAGIIASRLTAQLSAIIRYKMYDKIIHFSSYEIEEFNPATLLTRITKDVFNVSSAYILVFRFAFYGPLITIVAFIYLLSTDFKYQLACLIVGSFLLLGLSIFIIIRIAMPHYRAVQTRLDKVNSLTKENLDGLRVIRAYNAETYHQEKISSFSYKLMHNDRVSNRCMAFLNPVVQLTAGFLLVGISLLSSFLIKNNQFDFAGMTMVTLFSTLLLTGFVYLISVVIILPRLSISSKRIHEILELKIKVQDCESMPSITDCGVIEFKDVTFTYPGGITPCLKNISFKVKQGETIAFIGATGSGKTSIVKLMLRSFDADKGTILVDNVDVKKFHFRDLMHRFGYVPQKPYLFHETLRRNVMLGNPAATKQDYDDALEISQSNEFIKKLEKGENYEISQGGKNISGGQRQRVSIARALIKNAEILIFDDSFSAVDYKTDKTIRSAIQKKYKNTTKVIVAQRVGTVMDANQIIVLDNGQIVGKGTHENLLKTCKIYRDIALSQLNKKELVHA